MQGSCDVQPPVEVKVLSLYASACAVLSEAYGSHGSCNWGTHLVSARLRVVGDLWRLPPSVAQLTIFPTTQRCFGVLAIIVLVTFTLHLSCVHVLVFFHNIKLQGPLCSSNKFTLACLLGQYRRTRHVLPQKAVIAISVFSSQFWNHPSVTSYM